MLVKELYGEFRESVVIVWREGEGVEGEEQRRWKEGMVRVEHKRFT